MAPTGMLVGVMTTAICEFVSITWFALSACDMSLADVQARTRMLVCVISVNVNATAFPVDAAAVQAVRPDTAAEIVVALPAAAQLGEEPIAAALLW
jgi:hypothetical protein